MVPNRPTKRWGGGGEGVGRGWGGGGGGAGDTSPGRPNFLGLQCDPYFIFTFRSCFFFFCFPLHCLDSMSERLGRIISNAFMVSVEI